MALDPLSLATAVDPPTGAVPWMLGRRRLVAPLARTVTGQASSCTVLLGPPGFGKRSAARVLCDHARRARMPAFWLSATHLGALIVGLERIAVRLDLPLRAVQAARDGDASTHAERLWTLLESATPSWLVVLDDVTEQGVGHPAWRRRPRRGHVLVISRHGEPEDWDPADVVEMGPLGPDEGGRLLRDRLQGVARTSITSLETATRKISSLLAGMPVALFQVGELVARSDADDLDGWLHRLEESVGRDRGVYDAFYQLGLEALGEDRMRGLRLLRLLACFAPDEPLPPRLLDGLDERIWTSPDGPARDGFAELLRTGLIHTHRFADGSICPVLHVTTAERVRRDADLDVGTTLAMDRLAVELLTAERRGLHEGRPQHWPAIHRLEPHVSELVDSPALADPHAPPDVAVEVLTLVDLVARGLMRSGDHDNATHLLDRALARFGVLAGDHPTVLAAHLTRSWMTALARGGDLPTAERNLAELVAVLPDRCGPTDQVTLAARDTLAWVLAEQGDLRSALERFSTVLATRREVLPPDHLDTLATRNRMAWVTASLGKESAAVEEFEYVLRRRTEVLGADHLDVIGTTYRLYWCLSRLGRHVEAVRGFDDLLETVEELLGDWHPLALMVRSRCAWARMWAGEVDDAAHLYEVLLPEQEKVLGATHPRRLTNAHNLAALRLEQGRVAEAEEELRPVVEARSEVLGPDHPNTLDSRELYAWALFRCGRVRNADRELLAVLADRWRTQGPRHESVLATRFRVLRVVLHRGRAADAEQRARALLSVLDDDRDRVDLADPGVPETLTPGRRDPEARLRAMAHAVTQALALACAVQGRYDEAEGLLRSVVARRRIELGPDHPHTLTSRELLAWAVTCGDRVDLGLVSTARVLEARTRVLGPRHPQTLTSRYRWASGLVRAGRHQEAIAAFEALWPEVGAVLGSLHRHTLRVRLARVQALRLAGRIEEAYRDAQDLVALEVQAQGQDAVDTLRTQEELGQAAAALGRSEEAVELFTAVRDRRRVLFGDTHLDTKRIVRLLIGLGARGV
ncbi:tetratricopeptide repeat protein [Actinomycetospora atypica]|uniref:Tetratricopeptide repeat protein n=1 Tax=Actinomycetospora atypica TaxID=1290095 RepID=A0ABV9YM28_9PSEU